MITLKKGPVLCMQCNEPTYEFLRVCKDCQVTHAPTYAKYLEFIGVVQFDFPAAIEKYLASR